MDLTRRIAFSSVSLIDTVEKRITVPFRFKKMNTWVVHIAMRKEAYRNKMRNLPLVGPPLQWQLGAT